MSNTFTVLRYKRYKFLAEKNYAPTEITMFETTYNRLISETTGLVLYPCILGMKINFTDDYKEIGMK